MAPTGTISPATEAMELLLSRLEAAIPTADEVRAIYREAARQAMQRECDWLPAAEAARHCGWSLRTFQRKRDQLGVPYVEIDGLQRYWRPDLDAVLAAHLVVPLGVQVLEFPSLKLRKAVA